MCRLENLGSSAWIVLTTNTSRRKCHSVGWENCVPKGTILLAFEMELNTGPLGHLSLCFLFIWTGSQQPQAVEGCELLSLFSFSLFAVFVMLSSVCTVSMTVVSRLSFSSARNPVVPPKTGFSSTETVSRKWDLICVSYADSGLVFVGVIKYQSVPGKSGKYPFVAVCDACHDEAGQLMLYFPTSWFLRFFHMRYSSVFHTRKKV